MANTTANTATTVTLKIDGEDVEFVRKDSIQDVQVSQGESIYKLGAKLLVQTVTFSYTGRLTYVSDTELVLEEAAWVADTGRFTQFLAKGQLNEVEPFPNLVSIARGSIVAVSPWMHELPRKQK